MQKYLSAEGYHHLNGLLTFKKIHPNADLPCKESPHDAAWEITIIGRDENRVEDVFSDVNVFTTGLTVQPPKDYHVEILEHPQLYKTGYSFVGAPRVINPEDQSEILIPLFKFKEAEDLELPFRAALIILRQTEYIPITVAAEPNHTKKGGRTTIIEEEEEAPPRRAVRGKGKKSNMF